MNRQAMCQKSHPSYQSLSNKDEFWGIVKSLKAERTLVREHFSDEGCAKNRTPLYQSLSNKDEFWGIVKSLKAERTLVREHFSDEGCAKNRLIPRTT